MGTPKAKSGISRAGKAKLKAGSPERIRPVIRLSELQRDSGGHAQGPSPLPTYESVLKRLRAGLVDKEPAALRSAQQLAMIYSTAARALSPQHLSALRVTSAAELGRMVREERERRKLSQQAFADLAGVGRRFISELENGKPTLEFDKVLQVATAAGLELSVRRR